MTEERSLQVKPERHKEDLNFFLTKIFTIILDHNGRLHHNELWNILNMICQKTLSTFATFSFQDVLSFLNQHPTVFSVLNNQVQVLQDSIHVPNISSNDGKIVALMTVFFEVVKIVDQEKLVLLFQEFCESINKYQANLSSSQKFQFFQKNPGFVISSNGVVQLMSMFNSSVERVTAVLGATAESCITAMLKKEIQKSGKMHCAAAMDVLRSASPKIFKFFSNFSVPEKYWFFKNRPNHFHVSNSGYVKLTADVEEKVISFLLQEFRQSYKIHYLELIKHLKNASPDISNFFDGFSEPEKLQFFRNHPEKFLVGANSYVCISGETSKDVYDRKAFSYSIGDVGKIVKDVFPIIPQSPTPSNTHKDHLDHSMTMNGMLLEKNSDITVQISAKEDIIHSSLSAYNSSKKSLRAVAQFLLSVLDEHRKLHFSDLIEALRSSSTSNSDFFDKFSEIEKINFFKRRSKRFDIDHDGYVQAHEVRPLQNKPSEVGGNNTQQSSQNQNDLPGQCMSYDKESENKVVDFFLLQLKLHGKVYYSELIRMLKDSSTDIPAIFSKYSMPQNLKFFIERPDIFIVDNDGYVYAFGSSAIKDIRKPFISSELYKKLKEIIRNKRNEQHPNHSFEEIKFAETESNKTGVSFLCELSSEQKCDFPSIGVCDDDIVKLFSSHLQAIGKMHYRELFVILADHALSAGMEHERMQPDEQLKFFGRHSGIFHVDGDGHVSLVKPREGTKVLTAFVGEEKESPFPFLCCKELKHKISCRYVKQLSDVHIMSVQHLVDVLKSSNELTVEDLVKKACDADDYVRQFFSNFSRLDFALFFEIHSMFFGHNNKGKIFLTNAVDDHSEALMSGEEVLHAVHANIAILLFLCMNALKSVTKVRCKDLECVLESTPAFVLSFMFTNYPGNMFFFQFIKDYSEYFSVDDDGFISLNGDASSELIEHWILALFPSSLSLLSELKQKIVSKLFDSGKVESNISNEEFSSIRISDSGVSIFEPVDANLSSERSNLSGINFECLVGERFSYVNGIPTECNEISAPVYKNECLLMNDFSKASSFENRSMNIDSGTSSFGTSMKTGSSHNHMNLSHVQVLKQMPVPLESSMENVSDWLNSSEPPSKLNSQNFTENPSSVLLSEIEKRAIKFFRKVLAKRRVPVSLSDLQLIVCAAPDDVSDYLAIQFRDLHTFFQKHQNIFRSTTQTFISLEITERNIL